MTTTYEITFWKSGAGQVCSQQRRAGEIVFINAETKEEAIAQASKVTTIRAGKITGRKIAPKKVEKNVEWISRIYANKAKVHDLR